MRATLALPTAWMTLASALLAQNPPVDLSKWTTEQINGTAPYTIHASNLFCQATNTINTDCNVLYSDFQMPPLLVFRMFVDASAGDDDLCGFVIGWNPGDSSNANPDYLLVDWKRTTQSFQDWGSARVGLAVSRVTGRFTRGFGGGPKDLWSHTGVCKELARGKVSGSQRWNHATDYNFRVLFSGSQLSIWMNGKLEFQLAGSFNTKGRFGCYQFSQHLTSYQFPRAGSFKLIGTGCRGSAGTPYLFSPTTPRAGENLPIIVANLPATAVSTVLLGVSNSMWGSIRLPFDLSALGATGCTLYASADVFVPATNFNGTSYLSLQIPSTVPPGTRFHVQGMVRDARANNLGLTFSNGATATVGIR